MFMSDVREETIRNVLSDVGGVTFTFDKSKRKEIWVREAGRIVQESLMKDRLASELLPASFSEAVAAYHGQRGIDVDSIFRRHVHELAGTIDSSVASEEFAHEAGMRTLKWMLLQPIPTALLEYIQGEALASGELTAEPVEGIKELVGYVRSTGGVFKGYSTGAPKMPDQFHAAVGLNDLVGNVRTTYPGHAAKQRSADDIVDEARKLHESGVVEDTEIHGLKHGSRGKVHQYHAFIDDNENEAGIWADAARQIHLNENLGDPSVYLLRRELPDDVTGYAETTKGRIFVANSLDQIRQALASPGMTALHRQASSYEIDFSASDRKFG